MSDLEDAAVGPASRDLARSFSRATRQPTPPGAPRTAAGRALLDYFTDPRPKVHGWRDADKARSIILAIEAEAAAPAALRCPDCDIPCVSEDQLERHASLRHAASAAPHPKWDEGHAFGYREGYRAGLAAARGSALPRQGLDVEKLTAALRMHKHVLWEQCYGEIADEYTRLLRDQHE